MPSETPHPSSLAGVDNSGEEIDTGGVRPGVEECLRAAGLDVEYTRGEGNYLYYNDEEGELVKVLDFTGGYGASLFGHNHPRLVDTLVQCVQSQRPFNAQGSIRGLANQLRDRLADLVNRETNRTYSVVLDSTGSGAVEAAIKHAELEFQTRLEHQLNRLLEVRKQVRVAARKNIIEIPREVRTICGETLGVIDALGPEDLIEASLNQLHKLADATPTILALQGGFHGKSTGALGLTENSQYRSPWNRLGVGATFLASGDLEGLEQAVKNARFPFVDFSLVGHRLCAKPASMVNIIAAFVEPIQGEGGVYEVERPFLEALRFSADEGKFPLVFDEIQCGMGRTGTFLASSSTGVVPDYLILSKALGGGLCKISALLIDQQRYLADFDRLHTSTFAGDDHSAAVAVEALELLEENDGALMKGCAQIGSDINTELQPLVTRYPNTVVEVRGRGALMAVELAPRTTSPSLFLRWASGQGLLGYVVAGYLLRQHGVRIAPTLSNPNTLRIQPSAYSTLEEIRRFSDALEDAVVLLEGENSGALLRHLAGHIHGDSKASFSGEASIVPPSPVMGRRVAFLAHLLEPEDISALDPSLKDYSPKECDVLLERMSPLLKPVVLQRESVCNESGSRIELSVIGVPFTSAQIMRAFRSGEGAKIRESVFDAVELARAEGASVIGFGGYTSIATNSCLDVIEDSALITSGNSVTAAAAIYATMQRITELQLPNRRLGVVGAAGNLGCVIAELMAPSVSSVLLVGRPGAERRLERRAKQIRSALGTACPPVDTTTEMSELRSCGVIMTATNSPVPVIEPGHISSGTTVICDIATPGDVAPTVARERPDTIVLKGGLVTLPGEQSLVIPGMNQKQGQIYGCLAETILLGLDTASESHSVGLLTPAGIRKSAEMAERHGFGFEPWSQSNLLSNDSTEQADIDDEAA